MKSLDRLRTKAQDVLWGAGIAEIGTSIYIHEDKLALAGLGMIILSSLVEPRADKESRGQ